MVNEMSIATWSRFFCDMVRGKIPTNKDFYVVDTAYNNNSRPESEPVADHAVARKRARLANWKGLLDKN